jgi:hypothetical protein
MRQQLGNVFRAQWPSPPEWWRTSEMSTTADKVERLYVGAVTAVFSLLLFQSGHKYFFVGHAQVCIGKTGVEKQQSVKWVAVQTNCSEKGEAETKHFRHRNRVWSQVIMAVTMKTDYVICTATVSVPLWYFSGWTQCASPGTCHIVQCLLTVSQLLLGIAQSVWQTRLQVTWPPNAKLSTGFRKMFLLLTDEQPVTVILLLSNVQHSA